MSSLFIARIRHLIIGPGRHHRKPNRPDFQRMSPMQWVLMFSGQMMHRRYYQEKNGCRREYIAW